MRTRILAMDKRQKPTHKIRQKHRMPSEKEKNRNTKSVPTFMSPIRSKKSQPKSKGSKTPSRERRERTESNERGGNFKIS